MASRATDVHLNPSDETIRLGPLAVRFLITGKDGNGTVALFELAVPPAERLAAPAHSHDHYEETIYGVEGVLTWTVDGRAIDVAPGQALCIPRGAIHRFDNNGALPAKALCVITPAAIGPQYFRESAAVIEAAGGGPPDRAKLAEIMMRSRSLLSPSPFDSADKDAVCSRFLSASTLREASPAETSTPRDVAGPSAARHAARGARTPSESIRLTRGRGVTTASRKSVIRLALDRAPDRSSHTTPLLFNVKIDALGLTVCTRDAGACVRSVCTGASRRQAKRGPVGIGLAVAKTIVELHGGTIVARSDGPETGSDFSVVLPVAHAASSATETRST
jgi:quercetin dioxygenase-like cupin family protein